MTGPNTIDEIDCCSLFDHIDDLLDFPNEDNNIEAGLPAGKPDSLQSIWPAQQEPLPGSDSVFSATSCSSLSAELSVPYEDIVQLEWLSIFVEHCSEGRDLTMSKDQISKSSSSSSSKDLSQQFQTSSPVSVLESSSSSCSAENKPAPPPSPEAVNPARCGRARSKRPRPATFNPRPAIQLAPQQSSDIAENEPSAGNCEESDYPLVVKVPKRQADGAEPKKKKKIKFTMPSAPPAEADRGLPSAQQAVRKCLHCEITKTPQWRAGPLGPKTLCNACGVRYKSGRLFPEYRPAASPTFIPSLHSNSHKKVLEMRSKPTDEADATGTASALTGSLDLIPNMSHRLDYM